MTKRYDVTVTMSLEARSRRDNMHILAMSFADKPGLSNQLSIHLKVDEDCPGDDCWIESRDPETPIVLMEQLRDAVVAELAKYPTERSTTEPVVVTIFLSPGYYFTIQEKIVEAIEARCREYGVTDTTVRCHLKIDIYGGWQMVSSTGVGALYEDLYQDVGQMVYRYEKELARQFTQDEK